MKNGINLATVSTIDQYLYNNKSTQNCFFISHQYEDNEAAIELGNHIMNDLGYNIYLDAFDKKLQIADNQNDYDQITKIIQSALVFATHVVCLITKHSRLSWWVPYELGYAQSSRKSICTINTKNIIIPSYLKSSNVQNCTKIEDFDRYVSSCGIYGKLFERSNKEKFLSSIQNKYCYFD